MSVSDSFLTPSVLAACSPSCQLSNPLSLSSCRVHIIITYFLILHVYSFLFFGLLHNRLRLVTAVTLVGAEDSTHMSEIPSIHSFALFFIVSFALSPEMNFVQLIFLKFISILCVWMLCLHECLYNTRVPGSCGCQKRSFDLPELELQTVKNCHRGAGN